MKLLASDWDNTLRRHGTVSKADLEAIRKFREKHCFGIVTGRSVGMIVNELDHYGVEVDFLIGTNGAVITDGKWKLLARKDIELSSAKRLIKALRGMPEVMFGISDGDRFGTIQSAIVEPGDELVGIVEDDPQEILDRGVVNSFYIRSSSDEKTWALYHWLEREFGDSMTFHYNKTIDASAKGVDKAEGVRECQRLMHADEVFVIGDSYNDLSMIEALNGFAVGNACADVRAKASRVFDGLADCIAWILAE